MKQQFLHRVLWLLIPLLTLFSIHVWGATESITYSNAVYSGSGNSGIHTWIMTSCTVVQAKGTGTSVNSSYPNRWYQNNLITFTPKSGYTISKIELNGSSGSYNGQTMTVTSGGGSLAVSSNKTTWTGTATSAVTIRLGAQFRFGSVTITYSASASYTVTATRNDNSYGTVSVSGTTITATPSSCYQVISGAGGYTVTSGTATVSHTGTSNTLTVTPSTNCTVQVNFEKQTVNTYVDEIQGNSDIEDCGTHDAPSLDDEDPASSGTCAQQHWHFMGWVTAANKANPTDLNIIASGTEMTANGTTYYAVWAKGTSGGGFDNSAGGTFKIYADVSGTKYYATGTGSKITASTDAAEAAEYVFEKQSAGVYYIKTGTSYITYSSSTNLGTSASGYSWTVTAGTKGSWRLTSETSGRGFIFRSGTGFGGYSTGNVTAGGTEYYDVEIGGGYEYSDYMCTCCTELGSINGSFIWTSISGL